MPFAITPFQPQDAPAIRSLLTAAGLPVDDLTPEGMALFLVARDDRNQPIAAIGLEIYGEFGLLRSLAVDPRWRKKGLGRQLVAGIEHLAGERGVHRLYLLTTTAADFFAGLGYRQIGREEVPPGVTASSEFQTVCPVSAVCMMRSTGDRH